MKTLCNAFNSVITKEKFLSININNFHIKNVEVKKEYNRKLIQLSFDVVYPVKAFEVVKHIETKYDYNNIFRLQPQIKKLKSDMKLQHYFNKNMSSKDFYSIPLEKRTGWIIWRDK